MKVSQRPLYKIRFFFLSKYEKNKKREYIRKDTAILTYNIKCYSQKRP
jgi:hypothetical protein